MAISSNRSLEVPRGSSIPRFVIAAPMPITWRCSAVALDSNGMSTVRRLAFPLVMCTSDRSPIGGKCAVCGEAFDKPVKLFERGGAMYKGTVVKTYIQGQQIDVKVMVSPFLGRDGRANVFFSAVDSQSQGVLRISTVQFGCQSLGRGHARVSRSSAVDHCQHGLDSIS